MALDAQMFYVMLALPTLFGLTLVGEGVYKITCYENGWFNVVLGTIFTVVVVFGYFYLKSYIR
jgi:hypothetical protein